MGGKHRRADDNPAKPLTKAQNKNAQADTAQFPHLKEAVKAMEDQSRRMRTVRGRRDYFQRKAKRDT